MKSIARYRLSALALAAVTLFASQSMCAERMFHWRDFEISQEPSAPPADQNADQSNEETFTGVITKSGDQFVLSDPLSKTSYQLDDQRKAQELVNRNVRVTGVLDPSTGTIRVSAIDPI